jgi:hypothetical protein
VRLILSILIFLYFPAFLLAQSISARAYTDKTDYEVGDHIYYTIEISHSRDLKVFKPALKEFVKDTEIIRTDEPIVEEDQGVKKIFYRYILSKYDSADVVIPQIPIIYQLGNDTTSLAVSTNSVSFTVRTLPVNTAAEIKDVKPPIVIPMDLITILLILLGILLAVFIAIYFYKKNQKKKLRKAERKRIYVIPSHVKALTELRALEEKRLWQQGLVKEYHSSITEIIRRYFEDRFNILALESSTTEIMDQLTRVVLAEDIYKIVRDFLNNADLVKFAKYKPLPSINEEMMRQAIDIVENTVPVNVGTLSRERVNV